jgi:2-C-methyl-D-erythritol 4-phosphate cytidylyltransferase
MISDNQQVSAIIVAAGESRRMNGIDKVLAPLAGRPVIAHVLSVFDSCKSIDHIVLVVNQKSFEPCRKLTAGLSTPIDLCLGGKRRQDSVAAGLKQLKDCDWVVIHDGARPLVTKALIEEGLNAAKETGAAVAAVPVTDTIKIAGEDRIVLETPPRQNLLAVQKSFYLVSSQKPTSRRKAKPPTTPCWWKRPVTRLSSTWALTKTSR